MNPLHWDRENLVGWIVFCEIGALIGLLYPLYQLCNPSQFGQWTVCTRDFLEWIAHPALYWARPIFGALIAGSTFYMVVQMFSRTEGP